MVDYELHEIYFWKARDLGLSEKWISKSLEARENTLPIQDDQVDGKNQDSSRNYAMTSIRRVPAFLNESPKSNSAPRLKEGDILLEVNGKVFSRFSDFMWVSCSSSLKLRLIPPFVEVRVLRNAQEIQLTLPVSEFDGEAHVNVISWAGAIIQKPHKCLSYIAKKIPRGCYVSLLYSGSPASR